MAAERFVVLGLARVGSAWFRDLARWATSAALPLEFVKTVSIEEVRVRLRSGRAFSALIVDDGVAGVDRDLVDLAREAGCAVLVVDAGRSTRSWADLGVSAILPAGFGRSELLEALSRAAAPIGRSEASLDPTVDPAPLGPSWHGTMVAVTGAGGVGRSTLAVALAQGLAADPRLTHLVCLADLALHGEQGMLHDAPDVVPGITELVDAHRAGAPGADAVRAMTWAITERGYHLLLGLRRHRDWTAVRRRALESALDGLQRTFRIVVADVDPDVEGEAETGSIDVEERNLLARTVLGRADAVVAVGTPGMKGLHSLLRVVRDLGELGVDPARTIPLVNLAPRGPRARAELTAAFGQLVGAERSTVPSPVFVPARRHLEDHLRDGTRLPDAVTAAITKPVAGLLERGGPSAGGAHRDSAPVAVPVTPGSLGTWAEDDEP